MKINCEIFQLGLLFYCFYWPNVGLTTLRSAYAIAMSVCHPSVCNVHTPYTGGGKLVGDILHHIVVWRHPATFTPKITKSSKGFR